MQPEQTHPRPRGFRRRLLGDIFHGVKRYLILGVAATLCATFLTYVTPLVVSFTVDSVIGDKTPELPAALSALFQRMGGRAYFSSHIWVLASLVVLVTLLGGVFTYLRGHCIAFAGEGLAKRLRDRLFTHLEAVPYSYHVGVQTGDLVQRCTSDVETVRRFVQMQAMEVVRTVVMVCTAISIMLPISGAMTAVSTCLLPILVVFSFFYFRGVQRQFTRSDEAEGALSTTLQENLTGVRVVRAFGREAFERERFEQQNQVYTNLWVKLCYTLSQFWAVGDVTSCLQVMLVVVFGSILCVRGDMTKGEFVSFAFYNAMLITPVRRLGRMISEMSKAGVSVDRLAEVLNAKPEQDMPDAKPAPMDRDIVFEHVSFSYETGPEVLHDVSFTIPAGKSFGVLGATGSGKSTLLLLLSRLYAPTKGKITIGGADLASMPAKWVREHVGVVLQEPFLFSRTIEENIGITGASAEEIRQAAITACVDEDIRQFAKGYETMVGERGVTLSGGQKQRVAIARTLTGRTPIVVFDDSLSAVDTETDEAIRENLKKQVSGVTQILVSHRILTLLDCDQVLVLEHGAVRQLGTPAALLQQEGLFREIYQMQMAIGEEEPA